MICPFLAHHMLNTIKAFQHIIKVIFDYINNFNSRLYNANNIFNGLYENKIAWVWSLSQCNESCYTSITNSLRLRTTSIVNEQCALYVRIVKLLKVNLLNFTNKGTPCEPTTVELGWGSNQFWVVLVLSASWTVRTLCSYLYLQLKGILYLVFFFGGLL